jgi:uncharacterized repeat protein (TIGR03803 family)
VIFKVDATGKYSVLYSFNGTSDGAHPHGALILDGQGNLYGVSYYGGNHQCFSYGCGTVFKLDTKGKFTTLHKFSGGSAGMFPQEGLVRDNAGNLLGMTLQGGDGKCNCGTIFKVDSSGSETILHRFSGAGDGKYPPAGLTVSGSVLYGTTQLGGRLIWEQCSSSTRTAMRALSMTLPVKRTEASRHRVCFAILPAICTE